MPAQADTAEIAMSLGEPLKLGHQMVHRLVPQSQSTPNTYSGNFGLDTFPLHTDLAHWALPPRYLLLRCIRGYPDVQTLIFDGMNLISEFGRELLQKAVVRPRRPKQGEMRLLRLLENGPDAEFFRWDSLYLKPASRIGELAFANLRNYLKSIEPLAISLITHGDTIVIDNWRMLHGRSRVSERFADRYLERVYLEKLH